MMPTELCTFCDRPAAERHHVGGRKHCSWFRLPLCIPHHRMVTRAYENADRDMMKRTSDSGKRMIRALKACVVFMWLLLDHFDVDNQDDSNV